MWSCNKTDNSGPAANVGKGGSLARFIIAQNYLYVVDQGELHTYSLANPTAPLKVSQQQIGFAIETIYSWKDKLFVGSQEAIYVYSITNPRSPQLLGSASHLRACDPVVANDYAAYVTVRAGTNCGGDINALIVYNINEVLNPIETNRIQLNNPYGLGLNGQTLYVCDGNNGLKVFDVTSPHHPNEVKQITGHFFKDCIPFGNLLICMLNDGIALYNIEAPLDPEFLALITE